jgi:hypothetical protein
MTSLAERERIIGNIEQACRSGAALHRACRLAGGASILTEELGLVRIFCCAKCVLVELWPI